MLNRLHFLSFFGFLFSISALAATAQEATAQPSPEEMAREQALASRPNLILIIADDVTWSDLSPYGHDSILTPNLQRLASEGMRFDHAYVTTSSDSPSTASILTGLYPHQTDAEELHWPVPKSRVTFVEKLKEAGYWTAAAGKWDLGDDMKERFDKVRPILADQFHFLDGDLEAFLTSPAASGSADWIELLNDRPDDQPFFLWLSSLDASRPYQSNILEEPSRPEEIIVPPYHPDTPAVRADYQLYYDEITRLDQQVGAVMDELRAKGLADNTLILFISDGGRPFPRDKTALYDSGIKTPWIVRWPSKVAPGSVCSKLVSTIDIAKTLLYLGGVENPGQTFEGINIAPLLTTPDKPLRDYIYAEKNWHHFEDHARAVRNERYKYIRNDFTDLTLTPPAEVLQSATYIELLRLREKGELPEVQATVFQIPRPREELYDTKLDPHELNNLVEDERFAPLLRAMRSALQDWVANTLDVIPEKRTSDAFRRTTGEPLDNREWPRSSKSEMVSEGLIDP